MRSSNRSLVSQLLIVVAGSFAFGFALVPLYEVFCEITGFGGRTNTEAVAATEAPDETREIRVEFMTTVNEYAQFEFAADVDSMTVHPGKMYYATFTATNMKNDDTVAQAVPSVAPALAAKHFKKLECFCFSSQEFEPGELKEMPVRFIIDTDLPAHIDTITLSYTFFDTAQVSRNDDVPAHGGETH